MKWRSLLTSLGHEPVFPASLLQTGDVSRKELSVQLSRWVKSGHLIQLRRGVYTIAKPYRKIEPHPFDGHRELGDKLHVAGDLVVGDPLDGAAFSRTLFQTGFPRLFDNAAVDPIDIRFSFQIIIPTEEDILAVRR